MLHPTLKLSKNSADIFDLIINTLAIEIEWDDYMGLLGLDGTKVVVGIPQKQTPINLSTLIMAPKSCWVCHRRNSRDSGNA